MTKLSSRSQTLGRTGPPSGVGLVRAAASRPVSAEVQLTENALSPTSWLVLLLAGGATAATVRWLAYLFFCAWVIRRTGDPAALDHVATAARAFPGGQVGTSSRAQRLTSRTS